MVWNFHYFSFNLSMWQTDSTTKPDWARQQDVWWRVHLGYCHSSSTLVHHLDLTMNTNWTIIIWKTLFSMNHLINPIVIFCHDSRVWVVTNPTLNRLKNGSKISIWLLLLTFKWKYIKLKSQFTWTKVKGRTVCRTRIISEKIVYEIDLFVVTNVLKLNW